MEGPLSSAKPPRSAGRLAEPRRFIQVVAGARQVGKTTLVQQVTETAKLPVRCASADEPTLRGAQWIAQQWEAARLAAGPGGAILVLDKVQKAVGWSESVKRLSDEDTRTRRPLKVVLLGSAPLLVQQGLTESLAGRFEVLHLPHWSLEEMRAAFDFSVDLYLYFGGYPGAAPLAREPGRWRRYILDALVETTITRVGKPLFSAACSNWAAGTPDRCCPTPRWPASFTTPVIPRRSRTTSSCSAAPGCWLDSPSSPAAACGSGARAPSSRF